MQSKLRRTIISVDILQSWYKLHTTMAFDAKQTTHIYCHMISLGTTKYIVI